MADGKIPVITATTGHLQYEANQNDWATSSISYNINAGMNPFGTLHQWHASVIEVQ